MWIDGVYGTTGGEEVTEETDKNGGRNERQSGQIFRFIKISFLDPPSATYLFHGLQKNGDDGAHSLHAHAGLISSPFAKLFFESYFLSNHRRLDATFLLPSFQALLWLMCNPRVHGLIHKHPHEKRVVDEQCSHDWKAKREI